MKLLGLSVLQGGNGFPSLPQAYPEDLKVDRTIQLTCWPFPGCLLTLSLTLAGSFFCSESCGLCLLCLSAHYRLPCSELVSTHRFG